MVMTREAFIYSDLSEKHWLDASHVEGTTEVICFIYKVKNTDGRIIDVSFETSLDEVFIGEYIMDHEPANSPTRIEYEGLMADIDELETKIWACYREKDFENKWKATEERDELEEELIGLIRDYYWSNETMLDVASIASIDREEVFLKALLESVK